MELREFNALIKGKDLKIMELKAKLYDLVMTERKEVKSSEV